MNNKQEIAIPLELFERQFNLQEVGSICVLMASPHLDKKITEEWGNDNDFKKNVNDLIDKDRIFLEEDENGNKVTTINIDNNMKEPEYTMTVDRAIKELSKDGIDDNWVKTVKDYMEEIASNYYAQGYEDCRIDNYEIFTAYGKSEDFE